MHYVDKNSGRHSWLRRLRLPGGRAHLGVPDPTAPPALYPVSPYLAQQVSEVRVQHARTSGEAEWALVNLDQITLKGWVREGETPDAMVQDSPLEALLTPGYWLDVPTERGLNEPGSVLISGTVAMTSGVNRFARSWKVEMTDPVTGSTVDAQYVVEQMAEPVG
ncbi:UNVERIFIED_ORG: hypothetical protein ABIB21_000452 [Arthrobacter sp. UYEF13]